MILTGPEVPPGHVCDVPVMLAECEELASVLEEGFATPGVVVMDATAASVEAQVAGPVTSCFPPSE